MRVCVCSLYHHTMKCMHWFHSPLSATPFRSAQSFWARPSCSAHLGTATSRLQLHRQWENRNHEKIKQMRAVQKPDPFSETVWFFCGILSPPSEDVNMYWMYWSYCHHAMFSVIIGIRFFGWLPHCLVASCALERENGHPGWRQAQEEFSRLSQDYHCPE